MQNERGLQSKADDNSRQQWEGGDFPMLCEPCLGDNPYVRLFFLLFKFTTIECKGMRMVEPAKCVKGHLQYLGGDLEEDKIIKKLKFVKFVRKLKIYVKVAF
jgi:hypothetical protein